MEGNRPQGRPRKTLEECVKSDRPIQAEGLGWEVAQDRAAWRAAFM